MVRLTALSCTSRTIEDDQSSSTRLAALAAWFEVDDLFTIPGARGARSETMDSTGRGGTFGIQAAMGSPRWILSHSMSKRRVASPRLSPTHSLQYASSACNAS